MEGIGEGLSFPYITFGLTGKDWFDDTVVMTWASIRDWDNPGMNESFTCTTIYNRDQEFAEEVTIQNFYGSESFSSTDIEQGKFNELNSGDFKEKGPWE